jgi:hypothetical protein
VLLGKEGKDIKGKRQEVLETISLLLFLTRTDHIGKEKIRAMHRHIEQDDLIGLLTQIL